MNMNNEKMVIYDKPRELFFFFWNYMNMDNEEDDDIWPTKEAHSNNEETINLTQVPHASKCEPNDRIYIAH